MKLRPDYGDYIRVGGKTDPRELGCWRQYHVTLSSSDSVVCTLVFAANRDSTCALLDSTEFDFSLERVEEGASALARRALDVYRTLDCTPDEPLVLLRSYGRRYGYLYLDCRRELVVLEYGP
jgi:hypothetical protein